MEMFNESTTIRLNTQVESMIDSNYTQHFDVWVESVKTLVQIDNIMNENNARFDPDANFAIKTTKNISCFMLKPVAVFDGKMIEANQATKIFDLIDINQIPDTDIALYSIISYDGYSIVRYAVIE